MSRGRPKSDKRAAIVESLRNRNLTQRQIAHELQLSSADVKYTLHRCLHAPAPEVIRLDHVRIDGCARPVALYTAAPPQINGATNIPAPGWLAPALAMQGALP